MKLKEKAAFKLLKLKNISMAGREKERFGQKDHKALPQSLIFYVK
ncbi:MAG: hypothetical protein AAFR87_25285 [Bacteroidota bacterium]